MGFGNVPVGSSTTQDFTLTNSGSAAVTVSQVSISNVSFSIIGLTLPVTVAAGQSTTVQLQFAPQTAGSATATVSVTSNVSSSPISLSLTGTGTAPAVSLSPAAVNFGSVSTGGNAQHNVVATNTGNAPLIVTAANLSGSGFSTSGLSLPQTIAPNQSASFSVQFAPASSGNANGSVSIVSNAPGSPAILALSGTGVSGSALSASPTSIVFGNVTVGKASSQTVTLKDTGSSSVTISEVAASGAGFAVSGISLPLTLSGGQSTTFTTTFTSSSAGAAPGDLTITSNASDPSLVIALSANGTQPEISATPSTVNFGSVATGSNSTQTVSLNNPGSANLTISQASVSGTGFSMTGLSVPITINPGTSKTFSVGFAPTSNGNASGNITLTNNAPSSPMTIPLSGTGTAATLILTATPSNLGFGNVTVGASSSQTVTLKDTGSSTITISQVAASGPGFAVSGISLPLTLSGGQSTTFTTTFTSSAVGAASGNVTVTSTASNSNLTMGLSATGVAAQPQLTLNPTNVSFGSIALGSNATHAVTVMNSGNASLTISSVSASGAGFSWNGLSLPVTLAAGQGTSFNVVFAPTAAGSASGSISVASNAPGSPSSVTLSGTGVQGQLVASPTSVSFGNVLVGGNGPQTITLSNGGTASLTISQAAASGPGFSLTGLSLPLTLNAGANTSFTATFAPTAAGTASGSIQVTSNASNPSLAIPLSGTGIRAEISVTPSTVSFGSVATGSTSTQTISLNNPGTANLTVSQAGVSGTGFSMTGLTVPVTINPGTSKTFNAGFAPSSNGSASGNITLTSNAPGSPMTIPLSGTGTAATLTLTATPPSLSFGNVAVGSTSSQNVTVTNTGNSSVTISQVTASGPGYTASGVASNTTLTAGQAATLTVTLTPTSTGSATGSVTITSNASNSPTTIALTGGSHLVDLSWTASTSAVVGYNIYRGATNNGSYPVKLNGSPVPGVTFTDTNVLANQTYYYVVTAVDSNGVESAYSNQASATIPTP
ncbi:MAG: beta strand repeat-containing protein [Candidatus Acidiferrales bacterium]